MSCVCCSNMQVTVHNPENQGYLIAYKDSSLIVSSAKWVHYIHEADRSCAEYEMTLLASRLIGIL